MRDGQRVQYRYWHAIPDVLKYQVVTKLVLVVIMFFLRSLSQWALASTGRVAVTSGDFLFLFTSWQGILLIVLGLLTLLVYTALDLNTKVFYCGRIVQGREAPVREAVGFGLAGMRRFINPAGVLVVLYIALIAPIIGTNISISLTSQLYIPTFITSVIYDTPLYMMVYNILVVVFYVVGMLHAFTLHFVLLDGASVREALGKSRRMILGNAKDFVVRNIIYALQAGAAVLVCVILLPSLFMVIASVAHAPRVLLVFASIVVGTLASLASLLVPSFFMLMLTQLYYGYTKGERVEIPDRPRRRQTWFAVAIGIALVACGFTSVLIDSFFDELFPREVETDVIAHRAGGSEGLENSLSGLEAAIAKDAFGSEIDIQRTTDGRYVVNHDDTFERTTGDPRKPSEMTLAQVKELRFKGSDEQIPTLEEMLDASKGRIVLFVELKGKTADKQMADDTVRAIRERGMEDEVVVISLKYDLIDYIESNNPDIQTGFLLWLTYGDTASLHCDYLGLEAESATSDVIDSIHAQGKRAIVWTPNSEDEQRHFLCSEADGIITDNVSQAGEIGDKIESRSDLQRVVDYLLQEV